MDAVSFFIPLKDELEEQHDSTSGSRPAAPQATCATHLYVGTTRDKSLDNKKRMTPERQDEWRENQRRAAELRVAEGNGPNQGETLSQEAGRAASCLLPRLERFTDAAALARRSACGDRHARVDAIRSNGNRSCPRVRATACARNRDSGLRSQACTDSTLPEAFKLQVVRGTRCPFEPDAQRPTSAGGPLRFWRSAKVAITNGVSGSSSAGARLPVKIGAHHVRTTRSTTQSRSRLYN
jgi:hypothetical protein